MCSSVPICLSACMISGHMLVVCFHVHSASVTCLSLSVYLSSVCVCVCVCVCVRAHVRVCMYVHLNTYIFHLNQTLHHEQLKRETSTATLIQQDHYDPEAFKITLNTLSVCLSVCQFHLLKHKLYVTFLTLNTRNLLSSALV